MNQRVYDVKTQFFPKVKKTKEEVETELKAEDIMFDKAQLADEIEQLSYEDSINISRVKLLIK